MAHFTNTPYNSVKLDDLIKSQNKTDITDGFLKNNPVGDGKLDEYKYQIQQDSPFYFNILFRIGTKKELKKKFVDGGLYPGEIGIISDTQQIAYKFVDYRTQEEKIAIIGAQSMTTNFTKYVYEKLTNSNYYLPNTAPTMTDQTPTVNAAGDPQLEFISYDNGKKEFGGIQSFNKINLFSAHNGEFVLVDSDGSVRFKVIPNRFENDNIIKNIDGVATFAGNGLISINDLSQGLLDDINMIINTNLQDIVFKDMPVTSLDSPIIVDDNYNLGSILIPTYFTSFIGVNTITLDKFIFDVTTNDVDIEIKNNMVTPLESIILKANTEYRIFKGTNSELIPLKRYQDTIHSNKTTAYVASKNDDSSKNKVMTDENIISKVHQLYEVYDEKIKSKTNYLYNMGLDLSSIMDNDLYLFNYDGTKLLPNKININDYSTLFLNKVLVRNDTSNIDLKKLFITSFNKYQGIASEIEFDVKVSNNIPVDFNSVVITLDGYTPSTTDILVDNDNIIGDILYKVKIYKHQDLQLDTENNDIVVIELETIQKSNSQNSLIYLNHNINKYILRIKDINNFVEALNIDNFFNLTTNLQGNYSSSVYVKVSKSIIDVDLDNTGLLIQTNDRITTKHVYNARFNEALKVIENNSKLEYDKYIISYSIEPLAGRDVSINIDNLLNNSIGNIYYVYINSNIDRLTIYSEKLDKHEIITDTYKGKVLIVKLINILGKQSFSVIHDNVDRTIKGDEEIIDEDDRITISKLDNINFDNNTNYNITGNIKNIDSRDVINNILLKIDLGDKLLGISRYKVDKDYFVHSNIIPLYYDPINSIEINQISFNCNISILKTLNSIESILIDVEYKTYLDNDDTIREDRYSYSIVPSMLLDYELTDTTNFINPELHDLSYSNNLSTHDLLIVNEFVENKILYPNGQFLHDNPLTKQALTIRVIDSGVKDIIKTEVVLTDNETGNILLDYTKQGSVFRTGKEIFINITSNDPNITTKNGIFSSIVSYGSYILKVKFTYNDNTTNLLMSDIYISKNYGKEMLELLYNSNVNNNINLNANVVNKSEMVYGLLLFYKTTSDIETTKDDYIIYDNISDNNSISIPYDKINSPIFYILPQIVKNPTNKALVRSDFVNKSNDYEYKVSMITKTIERISIINNNVMSSYDNKNKYNYNLSDDYYYIIDKSIFSGTKSNSILNFNNGLPFNEDKNVIKIDDTNSDDLLEEFKSFKYYKKTDDKTFYLLGSNSNWYRYLLDDSKAIIGRDELIKVYKYLENDYFIDSSIISYGTDVFVVTLDQDINIYKTDGVSLFNAKNYKMADITIVKLDSSKVTIKNMIIPTTLDETLEVQESSNSPVLRDIYYIHDNKVYYKKKLDDTVSLIPVYKTLI